MTKTAPDSNSMFFADETIANTSNKEISSICEVLNRYSYENEVQIYVLSSPLLAKESYHYDNCLSVIIPGCKILLGQVGIAELSDNSNEDFEYFCEDFIEDLGVLSDKYDYRLKIDRPRAWKRKVFHKVYDMKVDSIIEILSNEASLSNHKEKRLARIIASLAIGSINDIQHINLDVPDNILEQIKQKIILFDTQQSRFIYQNIHKNRISIQGLAGTGKTELLLHKLRSLYTNHSNGDNTVFFTCYNKVLASSMRARVVDFFNFMKVDEQINWDRLHVASSWGSSNDPSSGFYSFICSHYKLEFHRYSYNMNFDKVCKLALAELGNNPIPCLDYTLVDESQDFPESFFELCDLVTKNTVFIAGDIFQDIYEMSETNSIEADYILNNCYRTDPKTLLFAHALGLGLLENPVIGWLSDENWKMCGYTIKEVSDTLIQIARHPLNRFGFETTGDFSTPPISIVYAKDTNQIGVMIIKTIREISNAHPTVGPGDIAIVFPGKSNWNYRVADNLSLVLMEEFGWKSLKGYEQKTIDQNSVFISNLNNIKGLEFPFIITFIPDDITTNIRLRNALYMILTRSFISSYLIANNERCDLLSTYNDATQQLKEHPYLEIRKPSEFEIRTQMDRIKNIIHNDVQEKSLETLISERISRRDLPDQMADMLHETLPRLLEQRVSSFYDDENAVIDVIDKAISLVIGE